MEPMGPQAGKSRLIPERRGIPRAVQTSLQAYTQTSMNKRDTFLPRNRAFPQRRKRDTCELKITRACLVRSGVSHVKRLSRMASIPRR